MADEDTSEFKVFDYKKTKEENATSDEGLAAGTKALLAADSIDDEEEEDIEFSAKTEVIQLTGALKEQLKAAAASTDEFDDFAEDDAQNAVKAAQDKVKVHYKKRAKMLEVEINKVIKMMKATEPEMQKKLLRIRKLLQLNTKGKPLRKKKK